MKEKVQRNSKLENPVHLGYSSGLVENDSRDRPHVGAWTVYLYIRHTHSTPRNFVTSMELTSDLKSILELHVSSALFRQTLLA